ncbi:MAG TPA: outer membrane beta-barrel protein [Polyangiaceae bacterium]
MGCSKARVRTLVVLAAVCLSRPALAGGGAATDAYQGIGERTIEVHGLLDVYAQHDFEQRAGGGTKFRGFDDATGLSLGLLRVTVAHRPDVVGFRVDAGVGDLPNAFMQSDPGATEHPGYARAASYVQQAFVTVRPPPAPELAIDAGKFSTPVGLEDNESSTNWNYSRSLLFTLAEPTYHTGARATYGRREGLSLSAFWLDGWNTNLVGGDGMRSVGAAATWRSDGLVPVEAAVVYEAGLEREPAHLDNPAESFRHELDAYVSTSIRRRLEMAATLDYGRDASGGGVSWWGVAGYMRYRFAPWIAVGVRGEHFSDTDGFMTGTAQRMAGLTGTVRVEHRIGPLYMIGWLEYRRDGSDVPVFPSQATGLVLHQDTLTIAFGAAF